MNLKNILSFDAVVVAGTAALSIWAGATCSSVPVKPLTAAAATPGSRASDPVRWFCCASKRSDYRVCASESQFGLRLQDRFQLDPGRWGHDLRRLLLAWRAGAPALHAGPRSRIRWAPLLPYERGPLYSGQLRRIRCGRQSW